MLTLEGGNRACQRNPFGDPSWPQVSGENGFTRENVQQSQAPLLIYGVCLINGGLNLEFILQLIKLRFKIN